MEKLYRVGEIMEYSGLSRQTVHLYTQMRLIQETRRTAAGYRLYDETVFEQIQLIKTLQEKGHTLLEIKDLCDQDKAKDVVNMSEVRS